VASAVELNSPSITGRNSLLRSGRAARGSQGRAQSNRALPPPCTWCASGMGDQTDVRSDVVRSAAHSVPEALEALDVVGLERSIPKHPGLCSAAKIHHDAGTTRKRDGPERVGPRALSLRSRPHARLELWNVKGSFVAAARRVARSRPDGTSKTEAPAPSRSAAAVTCRSRLSRLPCLRVETVRTDLLADLGSMTAALDPTALDHCGTLPKFLLESRLKDVVCFRLSQSRSQVEFVAAEDRPVAWHRPHGRGRSSWAPLGKEKGSVGTGMSGHGLI
jgi:hypothetical protein